MSPLHQQPKSAFDRVSATTRKKRERAAAKAQAKAEARTLARSLMQGRLPPTYEEHMDLAEVLKGCITSLEAVQAILTAHEEGKLPLPDHVKEAIQTAERRAEFKPIIMWSPRRLRTLVCLVIQGLIMPPPVPKLPRPTNEHLTSEALLIRGLMQGHPAPHKGLEHLASLVTGTPSVVEAAEAVHTAIVVGNFNLPPATLATLGIPEVDTCTSSPPTTEGEALAFLTTVVKAFAAPATA